jgi:hypothetical protein
MSTVPGPDLPVELVALLSVLLILTPVAGVLLVQ